MPFPFKKRLDPSTLALADVAQYIADPERATLAFSELQRLQRLELIDVYLPAGWVTAHHRRFNVWLSQRLQPPHGERITLEEWCARWLAEGTPAGGNGGAA